MASALQAMSRIASFYNLSVLTVANARFAEAVGDLLLDGRDRDLAAECRDRMAAHAQQFHAAMPVVEWEGNAPYQGYWQDKWEIENVWKCDR